MVGKRGLMPALRCSLVPFAAGPHESGCYTLSYHPFIPSIELDPAKALHLMFLVRALRLFLLAIAAGRHLLHRRFSQGLSPLLTLKKGLLILNVSQDLHMLALPCTYAVRPHSPSAHSLSSAASPVPKASSTDTFSPLCTRSMTSRSIPILASALCKL